MPEPTTSRATVGVAEPMPTLPVPPGISLIFPLAAVAILIPSDPALMPTAPVVPPTKVILPVVVPERSVRTEEVLVLPTVTAPLVAAPTVMVAAAPALPILIEPVPVVVPTVIFEPAPVFPIAINPVLAVPPRVMAPLVTPACKVRGAVAAGVNVIPPPEVTCTPVAPVFKPEINSKPVPARTVVFAAPPALPIKVWPPEADCRLTDPVPVPKMSVVGSIILKVTVVPSVRSTRLAVAPDVIDGTPVLLVTSAPEFALVIWPTTSLALEYKILLAVVVSG